jgi:hypothetical protein
MAFRELPDHLVPRRGSDMTARDYADLVATQVGAIPEEALPAEIDRLDTLTLGAPAADLMVEEEGISRLNAPLPDDADVPAILALSIYRMLLRTRQLALQHDPENADQHVREIARLWAESLAKYERELHGGEE